MKSKPSKTVPQPALGRSGIVGLLAAMALVLAPHMMRQPVWTNAFVVLIWLWRAWLAWRGLPRPSKLLITSLAGAGTLLTFTTYGTVLGRDAGVVLLELMLVMKLLEMRTLRDAMIVVFLGFFLVLTNFLHSQTLLMGAYMLGVIWILIATLIALNRRDEPSPIELGKTAGAMLIQAVPLMVVFFLLVPRVQGPLWGMPKDATSAISGLTEEMSPGSIGNLALSDAIAFRAEFDGPIPPSRALYWRAVVMNDFDGRTWRSDRPSFAMPPNGLRGIGAPISYRLTLEPHNRRWIFALDMPKEIPPGSRLTNHYQLLAPQPIATRVRYELSSHLNYQAEVEATPEELASSLRLPHGNPRATALGKSFRATTENPQEIIQQALAYFRDRGFVYTLNPPLLEQDPVDAFLFEAKSGFCEHYAGAFVFLMRAAGIPARVVTGYQGGEVNPIGNYLIVRQAEAHAWSEVWLPKRGWVRIDPTAAVSPARVNDGIQAALPAADLIPGLISAEQIEWLRSFRLSWDAVNNQWNQAVLGYNFERQKRLLAQFGQKDASWQDLTIVLMIASGIMVLMLSAYLLLRHARQSSDPAALAYEKFCMRLAGHGITRSPSEGPMDFALRAMQSAPGSAAEIREITAVYTELRYGIGNAAMLEELQRLVDRFPKTESATARNLG